MHPSTHSFTPSLLANKTFERITPHPKGKKTQIIQFSFRYFNTTHVNPWFSYPVPYFMVGYNLTIQLMIGDAACRWLTGCGARMISPCRDNFLQVLRLPGVSYRMQPQLVPRAAGLRCLSALHTRRPPLVWTRIGGCKMKNLVSLNKRFQIKKSLVCA